MEAKTIISQSVGLLILIFLCVLFTIDIHNDKNSDWKGVYKQRNSFSCGHACLKMMFDYHQIKVNEEEMWQEVIDKKLPGSTMLMLKRYAEKKGLRTKAYLDINGDNYHNDLPCITRLGGNHFIIIYQIKNGIIFIKDPLSGNLNFRREQFNSKWDRYVLAFSK